jgi:hypothetical protein
MAEKESYSPKNERGFTMKSWDDLRHALETMKPKSKLYVMVQAEMKKRQNWRNAPRGSSVKKIK